MGAAGSEQIRAAHLCGFLGRRSRTGSHEHRPCQGLPGPEKPQDEWVRRPGAQERPRRKRSRAGGTRGASLLQASGSWALGSQPSLARSQAQGQPSGPQTRDNLRPTAAMRSVCLPGRGAFRTALWPSDFRPRSRQFVSAPVLLELAWALGPIRPALRVP
ncbi:hypothetical protein TREES_T100003022 [Tupaia chinensis]|uniref:Uncharacterized protein n=1 Tax=Tupaia chinensis TaxID=246437 RepID=L9KQ42_TUPCH|nr:hypothetical protein TREES_T100003022 [Tupaia chinensis]